jgi:two-component system, NarL family, nitrate/nitrite response regulator NarL
MSLIQVALVGGSALHREGLRQSLDPSQFAVMAEGRDFSSVLDLMSKGVSPRLVIADVGRLCEKDFEDVRRLRDAASECRIAVLSDHLNLDDLGRVFRAGADGYLVSDLSREAFSLSLLVMMSGEKVLPGSLADVLASNYRDFVSSKLSNDQANLTERERQILRCLLDGHSNKHIARVLEITEGTVKVHLKAPMRKIPAANRTQAALWARSQGIGEDPAPLTSPQVSMPSGSALPTLPPLGVSDDVRRKNGNGELETVSSTTRRS